MFDFLKRRNQDPRAELRRVLGNDPLPSFPGVVTRALERIRDPRAGARQVTEVVVLDPALSARLLATVNSASHAVRRKIDSVEHAIGLLGMASVEAIILSLGVAAVLPRSPAPGFDRSRFWRAAARRATTARALAERLHPEQAWQSFTASLLGDMAVPALAHRYPDRYGPLLERWHGGEGELVDLEREHFGWSHAEVATWMCDEWKLPESLAAAIGGHHGEADGDPACPPAVTLAATIRETDPDVETLAEAALAHGLSTDEIAELLRSSFDDAESMARLYS